MVKHAYTSVPFYQEAMRKMGMRPEDVREATHLQQLPLVGKEQVTEAPGRFESSRMVLADGLDLQSSGTSGQSRTIRWDAGGLFESLAAGRRQRLALARFIGKEGGYREAVINRDRGVASQIRRFYEERSVMPSRVELQRLLLSAAMPFDVLLQRLNEFQPEVIRGYGSQLGAFLRWVYEQDKPFAKPKAVTYGADAMSEADRRLIEDTMGLPVLSTYQAVEALRIGFQCEARQGFHLSLDQVAVRVVDGAGRDVTGGGEIVISCLTNRATVLLNYRLGDVVVLGKGVCECGRTLPLLARVEGRADDMIMLANGTPVHALAVITPLQKVSGVRQVQVVQEALTEFRVRVVTDPPSSGIEAAIPWVMQKTLGEEIRVRVEQVEHLEPEAGGKLRAVISRVQRLKEA
jgi:phenylacetate-CoA ligase